MIHLDITPSTHYCESIIDILYSRYRDSPTCCGLEYPANSDHQAFAPQTPAEHRTHHQKMYVQAMLRCLILQLGTIAE